MPEVPVAWPLDAAQQDKGNQFEKAIEMVKAL